ncbi:MAG: indolepyruvate ferredoxin oxidoreductase subunit alpha [Dehalococcoidales bacterium]|nr:indolepyruvate ferredoxin oxidoreductase subunit alpha [Dehalococcoidales bacterium]
MADIDINAPGTTVLLMGNEAIARGALEAGVGFASSYPGTPASEILPTIAGVAKRRGIYADWGVNEMVAMESAAAASLAGIRSIAPMKQNGVNVCSDLLSNLVMRGVGKGLVLVCADDPGPHNSSQEQDTRPVASWLDIPLLEPGDFQEAKDMTKWLFDLSEEVNTICMLRTVSKISHTRGNVKLGEIPEIKHKAYFDQSKVRGRTPGVHPHGVLHQKMEKAREIFESSPFNRYVGPDKAELLIITCGASSLYSMDAVKLLKLEDKVGILKLGTLWPLPEKLIEKHLSKADKVLFVEEIHPFVEQAVLEMVGNMPSGSAHPAFYGKRSRHIPGHGELDPSLIINALSSLMGVTYQARDAEYDRKAKEIAKSYVTSRSGTLCPGCPHKASHWAIHKALALAGHEGFGAGDIGCYGGGGAGSFFITKTGGCMGAGIGYANGFGKLGRFGFDQPVVAFCGDSTFYHAAIPGLIDAIYNNSDVLMVIFDNSATSMTGFQPHAGTGRTAMGDPAKKVSIEAICRAIGARVELCDPFELNKTTETLLDMIENVKGVRVVIMQRECELIRARREPAPYRVYVDLEKCLGEDCGCDMFCNRVFLCTGLTWNRQTGKAEIDDVICAGCGVCVDVCPHGAIIKEKLASPEKETVEEVAAR